MVLPPQLKGRPTRWWAAFLFALALITLVLAEFAARAIGLGDVPVFEVDTRGNFILAPSQSGAFFGRYDWSVNERHLLVHRPYAPSPDDILLVGDSVASGGLQMDQSERLGTQVEAQTGCQVWPLAAPGWSLRSELAALRAAPDLLIPQTAVFLLNSEDFGPPSQWRSDLEHPRAQPVSALIYALRKKLFPPPEMPQPPEDPQWRADFAAFAKAYKGQIVIVEWPKIDELAAGDTPLPQIASEQIDIADSPGWSASFYRDSIHPTPAGTARLAALVAAQLPHCTN